MTKVSEVMSKKVPRVDDSDTILRAAKVMLDSESTGVAVFRGGKVVGVLTDRSLLRRFVPRNEKPSEVKVADVMTPMLRIDKDASTKEAAKKIVETGRTRLGVFDGENLVGWVTLTDVARAASRKNLVETLLRREKPEAPEVVCPQCKKGILKAVTDSQGRILVWECSNCSYSE